MLPENVVGIVDLATLEDIHRYLKQSTLEDDLALAAWVKEHFLYEPATSPGKEIRTTQGFAQLDRAYRRVRSLTNKTQDKWPFFNRAWKEMSATDVRKNSRGEAAPVVTLPGMSNAMHGSPMGDGQYGRTGLMKPAVSPFVPFGTSKPTRHSVNSAQQRQSFSNLVPVPPTKQGSCSDYDDPEKHSRSELRSKPDHALAQAAPGFTEAPTPPESQPDALSDHPANSDAEAVKTPSEEPMSMSTRATAATNAPRTVGLDQPSTEDTAHDLEGGKVRGINGRFMPKENPVRTRRSSRAKAARKSTFKKKETADVTKVEPASPATVASEVEMVIDAPLTPESIAQSKQENRDEECVQEIISNDVVPTADDVAPAQVAAVETSKSSNHTQGSMTPVPVYKLAAESEAVFTNLDRFPPGSLRNKKRKSEAKNQESPRPKRKKSSVSQEKKGDSKGAVDQISSAVEGGAPRMATRRTTRRVVAAKLEETTPVKHAPAKATPEKQEEPTVEPEDEATGDSDPDPLALGLRKTESEEPAKPAFGMPSETVRAAKVRFFGTPSETASAAKVKFFGVPSETASAAKVGFFGMPSETASAAKVGFFGMPSETVRAAKVGFFPRVQTPTSMVEVPVAKDGLEDGLEMFKKYAEWMEKDGTDISFQAFKSIIALAKKE